MKTLLPNHTTQETAYQVDDYPYGFRLRCKIRYWLERKKGFGYRLVSQTTNPKKGDIWNKPKAGVYIPWAILFLDDNGHVHHDGLHPGTGPERLAQFKELYGEILTEENKKTLEALEKIDRKANPISWAEYEAKQTS